MWQILLDFCRNSRIITTPYTDTTELNWLCQQVRTNCVDALGIHSLFSRGRGREIASLGRFGGVIGEERAKHSGRFRSLSLSLSEQKDFSRAMSCLCWMLLIFVHTHDLGGSIVRCVVYELCRLMAYNNKNESESSFIDHSAWRGNQIRAPREGLVYRPMRRN